MDRRSGNERRQTERHRITVDIEWENHSGRHHGTLSDISLEGCFVLASGDFANGERVFVYLPNGDGTTTKLAGEVSNHVFEIGFAVKFVELTEENTTKLTGLIEDYKK